MVATTTIRRTPRPVRRASGTRESLTARELARLADLPARIRARDVAARERLSRSWRPPYTAGDDAFHQHIERDRRHIIGINYLATFLRVRKAALLQETRGQSFYLDFGRSWDGDRIRIVRTADLARFAKARLRQLRREGAAR